MKKTLIALTLLGTLAAPAIAQACTSGDTKCSADGFLLTCYATPGGSSAWVKSYVSRCR
jgi:hypothetical protein